MKADNRVAIVHDYLTQRGGAERVVLSMLRAFPSAPLYTSVFDGRRTFGDFAEASVLTLPLNRFSVFRKDHRLALPVLAPSFSRLRVNAAVTICSSSGWAHGVRTEGRKVVYCYSPARWLYGQAARYMRGRGALARAALASVQPALRRWDRVAAQSADRYLVISTTIRELVRDTYGIEADILPPPHSIDTSAPRLAVEGIEPGFMLCICRLLPYKNVDAVVQAFAHLPGHRLVVVGSGPEAARLRAMAGPNVRMLGSVADEELRWLYAEAAGVVTAAYEDYGLTPLEAAAFGKPVAVLRWGGFLDTLVEGETGLYFDRPEPRAIADTVRRLLGQAWSTQALHAHARRYDETRFIERLRDVALDEARAA